MGFLDLVQQHHAVRFPAHPLAELPALLVADIAGRRSDKTGHGEFFHIFTHIDSDHILLRIKKIFSKAFRELGFAYSGRTEEEERADRAVRVFQPGSVPLDSAHDFLDGIVLAYDSALEPAFHLHYPVALGLSDLVDRDSGHLRDDRGYVLGINYISRPLVLRQIQTDHRASLVKSVYRLVRQRLVGDVTVSQTDAGLYGLITVGNLVESLIIRLEVLQNRDGLLDVSRFHDNLLESPVKSPVLLNNLGELVHSRGSDALELAAGQGRFQDIGRIQASLRATGSDNSVELVNKQDYVRV